MLKWFMNHSRLSAKQEELCMKVVGIIAAFGVCLAAAGCEKASDAGAAAARKAAAVGNAAARKAGRAVGSGASHFIKGVGEGIDEAVAEFKTEEKKVDNTVYSFAVKDREGADVPLEKYRGKVLLIVNTATRCGFTPQYEGLEAMYERLKGGGFELLDFPCNQFGQQAPGTDEEIHSFCVLNYKTAFPQFAKVDVNGENASPLFRFLAEGTGFKGFPPDGKLAPLLEKMLSEADPDYASKPDIKWNFTKFLVGRDGRIARRFEPTAPLGEVEAAIRLELER